MTRHWCVSGGAVWNKSGALLVDEYDEAIRFFVDALG